MGKLFSLRAASTIFRVVEGQGLLSRTAACCKRNCISSKFRETSLQCGISGRKNGGVSRKKKKGHRLFVDGKCVVGARTSSLLRLFNPLVVFISIWQSFKTCSRTAQSALEGRILPTPGLDDDFQNKKVITSRCQINLVLGKKCVLLPVEPIFELYFLRKYASNRNNFHITHRCLIFLHLFSLQKLARNSGVRWQKIAQKTATGDCYIFPATPNQNQPNSEGKPRNWQHYLESRRFK